MPPRRGHLFWGITFLLLGGVPLVVRAGLVPAESLSEAWRLWPVALIAAGVALILVRRGGATLAVTGAAVAVGLIGGTALAGGSGAFGFLDCGGAGGASPTSTVSESGTFDERASVELHLNCGRLELTTAEGGGWSVDASYDGRAPRIDAAGDSLDMATEGGPFNRRQAWDVALPADGVQELTIETNAGSTDIDLGSATLGTLEVDANAGEIVLRAGSAEVGGISAEVNAGRIRLTVGETAMTGDLSANAGSMQLCVPEDVNLRLVLETDNVTFSHNLDERGLTRNGDTWTRAGSGETVTFRVDGNAASFELDPEEGCG